MTYEQKYGRHPDGLTDLETPPEDWQFENSIPVKIKGNKRIEVPKLNLAAILPQNREAEKVDFIKLDMDKQIKLVAEEYNKETSTSGMCDKFGIGSAKLYERIHEARDMGLITKLRSERKAEPATAEVVGSHFAHTAKPDISITPDLFKRQAEDRRVKAEGLTSEAERLEQAGMIATELMDLLGESAQDLVNGLYERVN